MKQLFPSATVRGCSFHYTQCVWRKVQALGLAGIYKEDKSVRKWIRRAAALPLVPIESIPDAFLYLQEDAPEINNKDEFHNYIVETWLDDSDAVFPP